MTIRLNNREKIKITKIKMKKNKKIKMMIWNYKIIKNKRINKMITKIINNKIQNSKVLYNRINNNKKIKKRLKIKMISFRSSKLHLLKSSIKKCEYYIIFLIIILSKI